MSMTKPNDTNLRARALCARLREQRTRLLVEQMALLQLAFSEAVADARTFVEGTHSLPWEFAVAFSRTILWRI